MNTRILLVDDHRVVLDGLRLMLDQEKDLEVVGMAQDGRSGLEMVDQLKPDVVVLDISMPELNGVDAARQIGHEHPRMRVVALSTHTDERFVRIMLEAGADGYVTKEAAGTELVRAIRQVCQGRKYLSSDVTGNVVEGYIQRDPEEAAGHAPLGGREREVLQLIAEGATSGEIAARLHLSTNTVDTHRRNIMKKLDLHSIADLTKFAIREGLTDVEH